MRNDRKPNGFGYPPETLWKPEIWSETGIVASEYPAATEVGRRTIESGGNAIDAAIAMAFTLGVTEPYMSGIGGLGLAMVSVKGKAKALDGQTVSPRNLDIGEFEIVGTDDQEFFGWPLVKDNNNQMGPKSVTVPTEVAVLGEMHKMGSNMEWKDLVSSAIEFAEKGFECDWITSLVLLAEQEKLNRFDQTRSVFFPNGKIPFPSLINDSGTRIVQKELGKTLRILAEQGPDSLYSGDLARKLTSQVQEDGGFLGIEDLEEYRVGVVEPDTLKVGGYDVQTTPGLNGGPTVRDILGSMDDSYRNGSTFSGIVDEATEWIRIGAEVLSKRKSTMGYNGSSAAQSIRDSGKRGKPNLPRGRMDESTTYLAVVHEDIGVSLNMTLLSRGGSGYMVPGLGIMMNNGCLWFNPAKGKVNSLAAGVPPLENMAPSMVHSHGTLAGMLGSAGGRRIMPTNSQILFNLTRLGYDARESVIRPRVDFSAEPVLVDRRLNEADVKEIERRTGFKIDYSGLSIGRHSFASPIALWRTDGEWGSGIDPATVSSASAL